MTSLPEPMALVMAAALGDPEAARTIGCDPPILPEHYRSMIQIPVTALSHREKVLFACLCAERTIPFWEAWSQNDRRPQAAIQAARRWLNGLASDDEADRAGEAASEAGVRACESYDASDAGNLPMEASTDGQRAFQAEWAAISAAHAALTVSDEQRDYCAAYAAKAAFIATFESLPEKQWQTQLLRDLLMGRRP